MISTTLTPRRYLTPISLALTAILAWDCGGSIEPTEPNPESTQAATGLIGITVSTTGEATDRDADGYSLRIDDRVYEIGTDTTVTIRLANGSHSVELYHLAFNCVVGNAMRLVQVAGNAVIPVSFSVSCGDKHAKSGDIAFVGASGDNADIYVFANDTRSSMRLTSLPGSEVDPAWSPDGKRIAFTSDMGGTADIYVMNADGTNPQRLTQGGSNSQPAWSPDGAQIAFSKGHQGGWDIYVMNADGTDPRRLTTNATEFNASPDWSPDGKHIAFQHSSGSGKLIGIWIMDADGSNATQVTNAYDSEPVWSPDGTKIAFINSASNLFVMNVDGSGRTALTHGFKFFGVGAPAWSRDGRKIAIAAAEDCDIWMDWDCPNSQIVIMGLDGGRLDTLPTVAHAGSPAWRP